MWKTILAGAAAVAITGSSIVYAQQPSHREEARWRPSQEDMAAFTDARIAALKAGLRLTAEQEKMWPDFEAALRDIARARMERRLERRHEARPSDPVERLRRRSDAMTTTGAALKRLADAQEPLYESLDEAQKRRFHVLSRVLSPRHARFAGLRERGGHDWRGHHHRRGQHGHEGGPRYRL